MKKACILLFIILVSGCSFNHKDDIKVINPPLGFPDYACDGNLSIPGTFLVSINHDQNHYLADFTDSCKLIWLYPDTNSDKQILQNTHFPLETYHKSEKNDLFYCFMNIKVDNTRFTYAKLTIFDKNGTSKDVFYTHQNNRLPLDPHDAIVFDFDHYIIATSSTVDKDDDIQHSYIQEVKDGEILWEFDSGSYPHLINERYTNGDNQLSLGQTEGDYMHFNSFAIDPSDNNLLVSYRNQSAIMKINRTNGELMWKLGGIHSDFKINQDCIFYYQHSISMKNNVLLLLNNGQFNQYSKIMEIRIDEKRKTMELVNEVQLPYYISNYGEVLKLSNGNYLVQRGQGISLDDICGFDEIDYQTGDIIFSMDFPLATSYSLDFIPK